LKKIVHLDTFAKELAIIQHRSINSTNSEPCRVTSTLFKVYNFDQYTQRTKNPAPDTAVYRQETSIASGFLSGSLAAVLWCCSVTSTFLLPRCSTNIACLLLNYESQTIALILSKVNAAATIMTTGFTFLPFKSWDYLQRFPPAICRPAAATPRPWTGQSTDRRWKQAGKIGCS